MKQYLLIIILFMFNHCNHADKPDTHSPKTYDKDGIYFQYPGNWFIKKEMSDKKVGLLKFIKLQSKDDIVMLIQIFNVIDIHINKYIDEFIEKRKRDLKNQLVHQMTFVKSYEFFEELEKDIMLKPHRGLKEKFEIKKNEELLRYNCSYFIYQDEYYTIPIVAQCLERDWDIVEPGFDLIYQTINISKKN